MLNTIKATAAILLAIGGIALAPVAASATPPVRAGHSATTARMRPADNWWVCSPSQYGSECDGTDPSATGCSKTGIKEKWSWDGTYPGATGSWYVAVYYSTGCHTVWAELIRDSGSGNCGGCTLSLVRNGNNPGYQFGPGSLPSGYWTSQYYFPCGDTASAYVSQSIYGIFSQFAGGSPYYAPC